MAKAPQKPDVAGINFGAIPALSSGMLFSDIGSTGLRQYSGWVREEFLPDLIGRQGARVYREMADTSPIVGAVLFAIQGVLRKAEWRVLPPDDSPEAAEVVEFVESLRDDMSHTWEDFIAEATSMLTYGYAPHEIVYKRRRGRQRFGSKLPTSRYDDGKVGWSKLPLRGQDTILKWFFDVNGRVLGLTQQPWVGPLVDIPMEKMLLFRPTAHKNNPEGRSILRNAYRPYTFIKRLEEKEAILFDRMSGLPVVRVPNQLLEAAAAGNANAVAALNEYKKLATNVRIDEQMGVLLPSDPWPGPNGPSNVPMYEFRLETPQTGGKQALDSNTPISRHKVDILTSVLCDFLEMGHTSRGAQNLAETKVDLFMQAAEGWLNSISSVLNRHALPRILDLNGVDLDLMPELVPDMAQRIDLDALSTFVLRMSQAGMPLFPDLDLQAFIRDAAGLPDAADDDAFSNQEREDAGDGTQDKTDKRAALRKSIRRSLIGASKRTLRAR